MKFCLFSTLLKCVHTSIEQREAMGSNLGTAIRAQNGCKTKNQLVQILGLRLGTVGPETRGGPEGLPARVPDKVCGPKISHPRPINRGLSADLGNCHLAKRACSSL